MKKITDFAISISTDFIRAFSKSLGFLCGLYLLIIAACLAGKYIPINHYFFVSAPKTASDIKALTQLQTNGLLMSSTDLLNNLASFYSIVITVLAVFIGVSGIVAYIYIKNISLEKAEEIIDKKVSDHLGKADVRDKITGTLQKSIDDQIGVEDETFERLENRINELDEKLEALNLQRTVQPGGANGNH